MAGTSRVNREGYARFCGRLEVKFFWPTRQPRTPNRRIGEVGGASRSVLHRKRRPRRVVTEADPADGARVCPVFAALAFARPTQLAGYVAHGGVIGAVIAFQMAALSAGVLANSAASVTDLCGEKVKS